MATLDVTDRIARITDIIEQIEDLNRMIDLHTTNNGDQSTIDQYVFMRNNFIQELNQLMGEFHLDVKLKSSVA